MRPSARTAEVLSAQEFCVTEGEYRVRPRLTLSSEPTSIRGFLPSSSSSAVYACAAFQATPALSLLTAASIPHAINRMTSSPTRGLADLVHRSGNTDGGCGYHPGKASRIEPTCWAALSLSRCEYSTRELAGEASRWLASQQRTDGFLDDATGAAPNLAFNGLAALVLGSAEGSPIGQATRLIAALTRTKGAAAENGPSRQDNTLQGWSWVEGTFSWVEPTSWCLLALKKSQTSMATRESFARIDEAERLLLDRVCQTGGWNYGNSNVFGKELNPYVPTTALALLALQDRRDHASVQKSLAYLTQHRLAEPSGMALSLTSICLRVYGVPAADVDERLAAVAETHAFFNNIHVAAMALYSLSGRDHDVKDFRL